MVKIQTEVSHRLYPMTRAFQALVPSGSICIPVPDLAEPITNHLLAVQKKYKAMNSLLLTITACISHQVVLYLQVQ